MISRFCCPIGEPTCAARNLAPSTIASYLKGGDNLLAWLGEAGMPTSAGDMAAVDPDTLHKAGDVMQRDSFELVGPPLVR